MKDLKQPYVRFYFSDWMAGTRGMKAHEIGVYISLLGLMYEACEPLKRDEKLLAGQCGISLPRFRVVLNDLISRGKVTVTSEGFLWNERVEKEFEWRSKLKTARTAAGNSRAEKANEIKGRPKQLLTNCSAIAPIYQISESEKKTNVTSEAVAARERDAAIEQAGHKVRELIASGASPQAILFEACGVDAQPGLNPHGHHHIHQWIADGLDLKVFLVPKILEMREQAARMGRPITSIGYFAERIGKLAAKRDRAQALTKGPLASVKRFWLESRGVDVDTERGRRVILDGWLLTAKPWDVNDLGATPGSENSVIPIDWLREHLSHEAHRRFLASTSDRNHDAELHKRCADLFSAGFAPTTPVEVKALARMTGGKPEMQFDEYIKAIPADMPPIMPATAPRNREAG